MFLIQYLRKHGFLDVWHHFITNLTSLLEIGVYSEQYVVYNNLICRKV